ncbi:DoxX family protein [candidate division KSB1 bacterium]|nr:MAG: DoxX family protein [candidate division KSB1 bacterium]
MSPKPKKWLFEALEWVCRIVVAAVFIFAAVPKILDPTAFAKAVVNYRLVLPLIGQGYVYPVAMFLPPLELVAAVALLFNRWRRAGSLVCGAMLLLFIVLIAQAMVRGFNIDCGCFGSGAAGQALAQKVGIKRIFEDVVWLLMCAFVWVRSKKG